MSLMNGERWEQVSEVVDDMKLKDVVESLEARKAMPADVENKLRWLLSDAMYWDEDDDDREKD